MIAIKPIKDTISKARPINLNPNFKKKGPSAQNNNNIPTIMAIIPPNPFIIFAPIFIIF